MQFIIPEINISTIIDITLALILLVQGAAMLFTGKVFGNYSRYTEESVKKYARPAGLVLTLLGISFAATRFVKFDFIPAENTYLFYLISLALLVVYLVITFTILKKKNK